MRTNGVAFIGVFFFVIAALIIYGVSAGINGAIKENEELNRKKALLGHKIVIDGDTLTIVDYSTWNDNFSLSNGTKADGDYVLKIVL